VPICVVLITAAAVTLGALTPAVAGCYEGQGCTRSARFSQQFLIENAECEILWQIRNQIYHENGYCFRTPRGIRAFGNAGCRHDDINEVRLNQFERAKVAGVARVEAIKGCPR
jgi:hypothetical protein